MYPGRAAYSCFEMLPSWRGLSLLSSNESRNGLYGRIFTHLSRAGLLSVSTELSVRRRRNATTGGRAIRLDEMCLGQKRGLMGSP